MKFLSILGAIFMLVGVVACFKTKEKPLVPLALELGTKPQVVTLNEQGTQAYQAQQFDDAKNYFSQAVAAAPQSGPAHYNYALALNALGDSEQARQQFMEAANLAPGDKVIWDSPLLRPHGNPESPKEQRRSTGGQPDQVGHGVVCRDNQKRNTLMAKELEVGDKAPALSLPDQSGERVSLKDFTGKQVVLYFYPKDDTPGCTKESCDFRDAGAPIKKAGAVILGVSLDGRESHQKFIKKFDLPFTLLSDEEARPSRKPTGVIKRKICTAESIGASNAVPLSSTRPVS